MKPTLIIKNLAPTLLIGVVLGVSLMFKQPGWGAVLIVALEAYTIWRLGEPFSAQAIATNQFWLTSLAVLIIAVLSPRPTTQIVLILAYIAWRIWLHVGKSSNWLVAAVTQFLALDALFLAAAVWHWPGLVIIALTWGISWLVATKALARYDDRATTALAATWALVSAEAAWVFSLWLVNYIVLGGVLIISQAALVLTALGYCLGGIYASHRRSQLSRNRLVEYLLIGLFLLVIVIAGTKWNGGI